MSSINFANVYLLIIIAPLVILFTVPFAIAVRKDNVNAHNIASGILHVIMAVIIGFAAAGTGIVTTVTETDVYVLADVSYSATRNLDEIDGYISKLKRGLPKSSRLGVICFANDFKLTTRLGENLKSVKNSGVDESATNISAALSYTSALFKENVIKKIVLITDGRVTAGGSAEDVKQQIDSLYRNKRIRVDAIFTDSNLPEGRQEAQVCGVEYNPVAFKDNSERVTVSIRSNFSKADEDEGKAYSAIVKLKSEENEYSKSVDLVRGYSTVTFDLPTAQTGSYDYTVELGNFYGSFEDGIEENNSYAFTQRVSEHGKTLVIRENLADFEAVRDILGGENLVDCSIHGNRLPDTVDKLIDYDRIIIANCDLATVNGYGAIVASIDSAVSKYGKDLITFGNVGVQNYSSTGELKALDAMLPVRFGDAGGKRLFTILIDNSRSMQFDYKLIHAKQAASAIVNVLTDNDIVNIIEFNGEATPLATGVKVGDRRAELISAIDNLTPVQGTVISGGLNAAKTLMSSSGYSQKRLMLISDGLNTASDTTDEVLKRIEELRRNDVYTSTYDVGTTAESGFGLMNLIADRGSGKYFNIHDERDLNKVITVDMPLNENNSKGGESAITVARATDSVIKGGGGLSAIDTQVLQSNYAKIKNYTYAGIKASATTVLTVNYNKGSGITSKAPLYAYWTYGKGKVASFTSDISMGSSSSGVYYWNYETPDGRKLKDVLYTPLMQNVFSTVQPQENIDYPFDLSVEEASGRGNVTVTFGNAREDARVTAEVTSPDGDIQTYALSSGDNAKFACDFALNGIGKYGLKITYSSVNEGGEETVKNVVERALHVSYFSEYDGFALYDEGILNSMIGSAGTVSKDGNLDLSTSAEEAGTYTLSLTMPLLAACVVLYAIDIAVRKLKKEDIISLFKKVKTK